MFSKFIPMPYKLFSFLFITLFILITEVKSNKRDLRTTETCTGESCDSNASTSSIEFDEIPQVKIDKNGTYKYIQIKCGENNLFIRGSKRCKYHKNIYAKFKTELQKKEINEKNCKVIGGGRIIKDISKKTIFIYGYSKRYGRTENQHQVTKELLLKEYPKYNITWSNEGY